MAKAKKTTKKGVVITPDPKTVEVGIPFENLQEGEYFIMGGKLWQRGDDALLYQGAQAVSNGTQRDELCDETVIPVTVTIIWETK